MKNKKYVVLIAIGTRPEAIKMIPLIKLLSNDSRFDLQVLVSGQHVELINGVLNTFNLVPDFNLGAMNQGSSLVKLSSVISSKIDDIFLLMRPDMVIVHGDTATTFAVSIASFLNKIPVAHVEAGLRTGNINSPWPEEANRRLVAVIASLHFAPTTGAQLNLIAEGVNSKDIYVTGNTAVDAVLNAISVINSSSEITASIRSYFKFLDFSKSIILVTGHRRDNIQGGFLAICQALKRISIDNTDISIVFPLHLNPQVRAQIINLLGDCNNIHLIEPLEYLHFIYLLDKAILVLTDSGGIQEEAPSLNKKVFIMRDSTERPEGIGAGYLEVVGVDEENIVNRVTDFIKNQRHLSARVSTCNPYGDGLSSQRIVAHIYDFLFERMPL